MAETTTNTGHSIPYVMAYGNIKRTLDECIKASVPDRFTQDFLSTVLGIKGGPAKMVIPFLKKTGFLNSDGTVTDLYEDFRIESTRAIAVNRAIIQGYGVLQEMNEYFYKLEGRDLKDLVVRATGLKQDSSTVRAIIGSIESLKEYADFSQPTKQDSKTEVEVTAKETAPPVAPSISQRASDTERKNPTQSSFSDIRLGYTININLPATSDIAVYNAIFKSLRDNILDE